MRRSTVLVLGIVLGIASIAPPAGTAQEVEGTRPECVTVQAQPRMQAFGWDHIVVVRNGCAAAITCSITTDVNPSPTPVSVPAGQSRETLTWRGSPASVFRAHVDCEQAR